MQEALLPLSVTRHVRAEAFAMQQEKTRVGRYFMAELADQYAELIPHTFQGKNKVGGSGRHH